MCVLSKGPTRKIGVIDIKKKKWIFESSDLYYTINELIMNRQMRANNIIVFNSPDNTNFYQSQSFG